MEEKKDKTRYVPLEPRNFLVRAILRCLDCGNLLHEEDISVHDRFHSSLDGNAWALGILSSKGTFEWRRSEALSEASTRIQRHLAPLVQDELRRAEEADPDG
jgi:hypothetical protein